MSGVALDLNSLPEEGRHPEMFEYTGVLSKDGDTVANIAVRHLPMNLPRNLNFSRIEHAALHPIESLPAFELHPYPNEEDIRRGEWLKFLKYLYERDKVVPITVNGWQLFISPPKVPPNARTSVRVCYRKSNGRPAAQAIPPPPLPQVAVARRPHANGNAQPAPLQGKVQPTVIPPNPRRFGQMHPSYLQTLAQLHASWQFGGLAELVDNSRDAHATRINISISMVKMKVWPVKGSAEYDKDQIGHFGVGFKSGSMRLGKDVIVLTQTDSSRSIGFLSTSYNADKEVLEVPIVTYRYSHGIMELDDSVQTQEQGEESLQAVERFSPFNEFEIVITLCNGTDEEDSRSLKERDITIRSGRVRARPSQTSKEIPLDYSLRAYLEVLFSGPKNDQSESKDLRYVKTKRLAESLNKTSRRKGNVCNIPVELTLGRSICRVGARELVVVFLYWHGRLIEAYKRVGGMLHSADVGRGVIGVIDVTTLMEHEDGRTSVLNTKQSFEDCEEYAMLEQWLGDQFNDYWNTQFDRLEVIRNDDQAHFEPDREWVQCDKCRKWRKLPRGVHSIDLPDEWFCYMKPFERTCNDPEEKAEEDIVTVGVNRSSAPAVQPLKTTLKVEAEAEDDEPIVMKRNSRKSAPPTPKRTPAAVRTREISSSPKEEENNISPMRKRLRKRK
ncbi:hypothetical protein R1sor_009558 [Riccia sorocarpa]|uniref:CW-type domain-containing protein n=1 Tax=Riccia sorocarpa TaxID=122646 RepID=A0ABD3HY73_9MARC